MTFGGGGGDDTGASRRKKRGRKGRGGIKCKKKMNECET